LYRALALSEYKPLRFFVSIAISKGKTPLKFFSKKSKSELTGSLEGKSSTGRLGIDIHATAGKGDVGFCGHWTLEISVKQPVKIYKGMPIGQLIYFPVEGPIQVSYNQKKNSKYSNQPDKPVESMMWKNKF
jgi:deoxycytidine triphosphate deaminase